MILKDCERCLIYTPKGERFSEARVVHTKSSVSLFFTGYNYQDSRFQSRVDFYDDMAGLVVTRCEVIIHRNPGFLETGEAWMADCQILEVVNVVQRQRDIRAKVYLEVGFKRKNGGYFYGTIRNLSAGGMYITSIQPLKKGDLISFAYSFRTLERPYDALVLWGKQVQGGRYGYGCRFIHLTDGAEAAVRSFVYKKLLEKGSEKD